jgi:hypothetical protein
MSHSIRLNIDFVLRQQSKPYLNDKLFFEYNNSIFVHYLNERLVMKEFEAYEAVLLIDNCSSLISDDVIAILNRERVKS